MMTDMDRNQPITKDVFTPEGVVRKTFAPGTPEHDAFWAAMDEDTED